MPVVQSDGKILVAGSDHGQITIARYHADGSLDSTFGTGGIASEQVTSGNLQIERVQIESDGKLEVIGLDVGNGVHAQLTIDRFNTDGTIDTSFGGTKFVGDLTDFRGVMIQPDGKIVALTDQFLMRFNIDGSLDTSFNGTGRVALNFGSQPVGYQLAMDASGHLIVAGEDWTTLPMFVARYNSDGTLDQSFGTAGLATISFGDDRFVPESLAIDAQGGVVVGGVLQGNEANLLNQCPLTLIRLTSGGELDGSFGTGGHVSLNLPEKKLQVGGMLIQNDGKIVIVAHYQAYTYSGPQRNGGLTPTYVMAIPNGPPELIAARFDSDGALDSSFGTGGTSITTGPVSVGIGLVQQADGKLLAVSSTQTQQGEWLFSLTRFATTGTLDSTFGNPPPAPPAAFVGPRLIHVNAPIATTQVTSPVASAPVVSPPSAPTPAPRFFGPVLVTRESPVAKNALSPITTATTPLANLRLVGVMQPRTAPPAAQAHGDKP